MNWFNRAIVTTMPLVPKPIVRKLSARYIAGTGINDVVKVIRNLQEQGCCATVDILGEHIFRREEAQIAVDGYSEALQTITSEKLDSNISVKLTQLGLTFDKDFCLDEIRKVVEVAGQHNNFVRIDMEDSACTTPTLEIYNALREDFEHVGPVIQAYMRRSLQDIRELLATGKKLNVRLCKGIYIEPRAIAYRDYDIVNQNYVMLLRTLLENGAYVGIATHDEKLVWHAFKIIDELKLKPDQYEFQMLLGVDEELRRIIVGAGHKLRVYVPYGNQWYAYSVRRLKENPQIAGYIVKNMFSRNGK